RSTGRGSDGKGPAAQAGSRGSPRGHAEHDGDPNRRHRQYARLARHAVQALLGPRGRRDSRVRCRGSSSAQAHRPCPIPGLPGGSSRMTFVQMLVWAFFLALFGLISAALIFFEEDETPEIFDEGEEL